MRVKINISNFLLVFLISPFLFPRGFSEYFPLYKNIYTAWLFMAIIVIYLLGISKYKQIFKSKYMFFIFCYFIVMAIITVLIRHTFAESLQKIFATFAICLLCSIYLSGQPKRFICVTNDILVIVFTLNATVFNPLLWSKYFAPITNHMTFLGHVQIGTQFGMLGVVLAYIEYQFLGARKKRVWFQTVLSLITMIMSFTSAAYIAIAILILFLILNKTKLYKIFTLRSQSYLLFYIIINLFLFYSIYKGTNSVEIFGFSINGRGFIWKEAIDTFLKSPFYGYGVHGVTVKVFWSIWVGDGSGMNYMHNQILQVLIDGGVILLVPFISFLYFAFEKINRITDNKERFWFSSFIMILLIIMTFESTMEYFYVFYILCIFAYLPVIFHNRGDWK